MANALWGGLSSGEVPGVLGTEQARRQPAGKRWFLSVPPLGPEGPAGISHRTREGRAFWIEGQHGQGTSGQSCGGGDGVKVEAAGEDETKE